MKNLTYCLLAGLCLQAAAARAAQPHGATATTTTLAESVKRVVFGQPITLTAVVSPAAATGPVTFYADSTDFLGIATISGGRARLTTQLLSTGSHALSAYYAGNATYAPSTSAKLVGTVVALPESGLQAAASFNNVGNHPYALALADFNGDGKMDIVAACAGDPNFSTISILLGNGDGTFADALNSMTTPSGAQSVVTGDFNGDGKVDIAVDNGSNAYAPAVSVLLGTGDGTFQAPVTYPLGLYLAGIMAADINGDGIEDLVVSNNANGTSLGDVEVLLGKGDGTFQPPIVLTADFSPEFAVVADFNGDGKADVAVPNYNSNDISILLGNGDGTFQPAVNYPSGGAQPETIAFADFNGDGKLDIAAANVYGYTAGVFLGNGDGTFQTALAYPVSGVGRPLGIAAGDMNGDGLQDLVVTSDTAVSVLLGNGDGTFQSAVEYPVGNFILGVALGDFNSDGRAEVAFANINGNTVGILLGLPLPATTSTALTVSPNPSTYLQPVTITANIFPPLATGRISFYDGSTLLGSATIAAGKATLPISTLAPGSHTLRAVYDGDANDLSSKSAPVTLTVNKIATASTLSSTPNPSTYGNTVTFTAQVAPSGATGTVTFYDASAALGSAPLSGGLAALSISTLSPGAHTITAAYSGDNDFAPSTSAPLTQNVKRVATATGLTAAPNPSRVGQNVKLTASVSPTSATGSVTFYDGTTAIASRTLSAGAATFNTTSLAVGTHSLKAAYSGDGNNAPSSSPVISHVVQ